MPNEINAKSIVSNVSGLTNTMNTMNATSSTDQMKTLTNSIVIKDMVNTTSIENCAENNPCIDKNEQVSEAIHATNMSNVQVAILTPNTPVQPTVNAFKSINEGQDNLHQLLMSDDDTYNDEVDLNVNYSKLWDQDTESLGDEVLVYKPNNESERQLSNDKSKNLPNEKEKNQSNMTVNTVNKTPNNYNIIPVGVLGLEKVRRHFLCISHVLYS